jgi:hypothetical protein
VRIGSARRLEIYVKSNDMNPMTDDPNADRRRLTFEQAEGIEPLPAQLQLKEMSPQLRAILWQVVHSYLDQATSYPDMGRYPSLNDEWFSILQFNHVRRKHGMIDDLKNVATDRILEVKKIFSKGEYHEIFGFLQFVMRLRKVPHGFPERINTALEISRAAYRVLDRNTIIPISSEAERATLERAFSDLVASEFHGARSHLRAAGSELTAGNYAPSIRESIHAVESVARTLAPRGMLREALATLEKSAVIHPALKSGFMSIYGYTNDEKGIRHPLVDDAKAKVDEADALFMIGACASFVSYMIHKAKLAGTLPT